MSVSLSKGGNVSLTKQAPNLRAVLVGLGWDERTTSGAAFDLDASALMVNEAGRILSDAHFVFFNNLKSPDGSVEHTGDNLTGAGEGDDEVIAVDLDKLSSSVQSLVFVVNSFSGQKFTAVRNAFCRLVDDTSNQELVRFDLSDSKPQTGLVMCKVARGDAGWVMTAIGEFHDGKTVRAMVDPAKRYL